MVNVNLLIALFPIIVLVSVVFGFETTLYLVLTLVGFILWTSVEDPFLKFIGSYLLKFGTVFLLVSSTYYLTTGQIFPQTAPQFFQFRISLWLLWAMKSFWARLTAMIGEALLGLLA